MGWKQDVRSRFSPEEDLLKWDRMYEQETENLEDEFFRRRRDLAIDYVTSRYDTNAKICDLGCGAGPVISELLKRGYDMVGLDYSTDMLEKAAERIDGRRPLASCDIQSLPLRDASFDCALCLGVISYVEHYETIIEEIQRILKPGGTAIITYRNETNPIVSDPVGPFRFMSKKTLQFLGIASNEFRIGNCMSFTEVRRVLRRNGLALETFKGIGFGPLRFNHRPLLSESASLRIHRALTRWMDALGAEFPFRIATDVHILAVRKPDPTRSAKGSALPR